MDTKIAPSEAPTAADKPWYERENHQTADDVAPKKPAPAPAHEGAKIQPHEVEHHSTSNKGKR